VTASADGLQQSWSAALESALITRDSASWLPRPLAPKIRRHDLQADPSPGLAQIVFMTFGLLLGPSASLRRR
jgi:hypothetical protein